MKRSSLLQGRVTFAWIYQNRPNEARYAIVSTWDCNTHRWQYEVLDLFSTLKDQSNGLTPPTPRWVHEELSAAIMATVLMYGDTCNNV